MKMIKIKHFESQTTKILDQVSQTQESIVIIKDGKPLVQITPFHYSKINPIPGQLANVLVFEKDIITPLGDEMWESCQ